MDETGKNLHSESNDRNFLFIDSSKFDLSSIFVWIQHDLNVPIMAVKSRVWELQNELKNSPIEISLDEINHWLSEMDLILQISRVIFSSEIPIEQNRTNIKDLLHRAIAFIKYRERGNFLINFNNSENIPLFWVDRFQFILAFKCLLYYLLNKEFCRHDKLLIDISYGKPKDNYEIIRFRSNYRNSYAQEENYEPPLKTLLRLEYAALIIKAHGGKLEITAPFQDISIWLPSSLTKREPAS